MKLIAFGCAPWQEIATRQADAVRAVQAGGEELVLFGEHPPTLSLGRRSPELSPDELRAQAARGLVVVRSDRGGATTVFAPGQAIVYPIVRLRRGVVDHVARLAAAGRAVAVELGVESRFDRQHPGLWVGPKKLASIGLRVERRVTSQGLAFNVAVDLGLFAGLEICATPGLVTTSLLAEGAPALPSAIAVAERIATAFRLS